MDPDPMLIYGGANWSSVGGSDSGGAGSLIEDYDSSIPYYMNLQQSGVGAPDPSAPLSFNVSSIEDVVKLIDNLNFFWFLMSLVSGIGWVIYIGFYSSRISGLVVGKILNRFVKGGNVSIGSFSLSVLSGKIMFRDVSFVSEDFSVRVQDGWIIFRWWRAYVPKDISEDMSHSDTRLSILLNGWEYHIYNRTQLYSKLEKLFGLDPLIIPNWAGGNNHSNNSKSGATPVPDPSSNPSNGKSHPKPPSAVGYSWRDLIPVIKIEICSGRFVFGNSLSPYTLALVVEEANLIYTTKPADSKYDHFMHIVKCKAENFKVLLSPSPKYTGLKDDPPRLMGEGFGVVTSNKVEFYYYMDEPGVVPKEPEMNQLANGDWVEANPPIWGIDIKCGKGTDFSYGPWADRQRESLYKIFFPQDYQPLCPTPQPKPGEPRLVQSFDIRLSTLSDATVDILFSKDEETNAIHMNIGPGSYMEITIPWICYSGGYTTKITGQLLHLEASTSLQFRDLVISETLQFNINSHYPIHWNEHQSWTVGLTGSKATAHLIYSHKWFFQALINDWSSRSAPDLLHFVPYTYNIQFILKEFEIITPTNEFNWIDCSSQHHENSLIGACGEIFELSFSLPFHEFLPETVLFKFWVQVECGDLYFYIPDVSSSYTVLQSLMINSKVRNRDGTIRTGLFPKANSVGDTLGKERGKVKKWRNVIQATDGWIECWSVPICAVSINFTYHPIPPLGPSPQADVTTPEKEEILLGPIRMPADNTPKVKKGLQSQETQSSSSSPLCSHTERDGGFTKMSNGFGFDVTSLPADKVHVELEVGPSFLLLYGSLLKLIINLKENVFGDSQQFIDMERVLKSGLLGGVGAGSEVSKIPGTSSSKEEAFDPREFRPLEVTVSVTLHDIRANLLKNCTDADPPCPTISVERFGFEMDKRYRETRLQVFLSPITLAVTDNINRAESGERHLNEGYLMLSGLQVRGHALFSNEGRALGDETLEYGWLVEILLGKLSGRLTGPHLENIVTSLETFFLLVLDAENSLRSPHSVILCHHGNNQFDCPLEQLTVTGTVPGISVTPAVTTPMSQFGGTILEGEGSLLGTPGVGGYTTLRICPTAEEIKYKMVRVGVDSIDIYLVEDGTALNLWISPIRSSLCNLHGPVMKEGITLLIPKLQLRHFVMVNPSFTKRFQFSDMSMVQSSSETMTASWGPTSVPQSPASTTGNTGTTAAGAHSAANNCSSWSYLWLEAGAVALGPLSVDIALKGSTKDLESQKKFLLLHDKKTKSLWFLWQNQPQPPKCACIGGTKFFGSNAGGQSFFWPSSNDWTDGINVCCLRVNKPSQDPGFGQSILKSSALIFDTPPYTTHDSSNSSTTFLELHAELRGGSGVGPGTSPGSLGQKVPKTPYVFKPSLLADLSSHTSSSVPTERERANSSSNYGSTLQSVQSRRSSHPSQPSLRRQSRISDAGPIGSDYQDDDVLGLPLSASMEQEQPENWLGDPYPLFKSTDELGHGSSPRKSCASAASAPPLEHVIPYLRKNSLDDDGDGTLRETKAWAGSMNSLDSLSDVSFISALSAQEECMVNLQSHLNKPITESSLLMPCYMSHLTQLKCDNWQVASPTVSSEPGIGLVPFLKTADGKLLYAGSKYTPYFDPLVDGFTTLAMINAAAASTPGNVQHASSTAHTPFWDPNQSSQHSQSAQDDEFYRTIFSHSHNFHGSSTNIPEEDGNQSISCTTIIVRTKNDLNIMVSPMLLEALHRFVVAVTPTLCSLHPLTVVNHLHSECISRVERANLLKKEKSILLTKIQNSKRNTAIRAEEMSPAHSNLFEEITQSAIEGSITIPKINITLLQASVVEEVISFSALDNIRDLMCVSLLAVAIEQTNIYFTFKEQVKKSVQVLYRPSILPKTSKKGQRAKINSKIMSSTRSDSGLWAAATAAEPVFIENSEKQSQLMSSSIQIQRLHAQLRRLKNDSSILKEAVITAIPNQHSKVLFRFAKIPNGLFEKKGGSAHQQSSSASSTLERDASSGSSRLTNNGNCPDSQDQSHVPKSSDEKLGFIMAECGLEGISLKGVKNTEDVQLSKEAETEATCAEKDETVSVTLCNESYLNLNVHSQRRGNSTPNLYSGSGDRETATLLGNSKEDFSLPVDEPEKLAEASARDEQTPDPRDSKKPSTAPSVSCVIQFNSMWYNFAAPPQTPITRKIDYTRVDWNLVSTASTAINAWLNPIDQLTISMLSMLRGHSKRKTGLLASLMADALEIQSIHQPVKSKYSKLTALAKTLLDDPSCQLCVILKKFISTVPLTTIEANVAEPSIPQLSTLRQGVIVMSRQWKNVLYTPLLLEHNLKSKKSKNFTVTFTLPQSEEESPGSEDGDLSAEEFTADERATLLDVESGVGAGTISLGSMRRTTLRSRTGTGGSNGSSFSENLLHKPHLPSQPLGSTRASDCYPLPSKLSNSIPLWNFGNSKAAGNNNKKTKFGSIGSFVTGNWSLSSNDEDGLLESGRSTPGTRRDLNNSSIIKHVADWNNANDSSQNMGKIGTLMSEQSHEESILLGTHSKFPQHPSLMLLDAHLIFKPLLTSLGLMPNQIIGHNFEALGSHMSIKASIDMLRIDIVESEGKGQVGGPTGSRPGSLKSKSSGSYTLNIPPETPAFLCEKIGVEGDFQKSTDFFSGASTSRTNKNLLYYSRAYWKKQAKSSLIFSLNIDYISQQVNMPLLRLLHQITTMIQNVRETQMELREQRPVDTKLDGAMEMESSGRIHKGAGSPTNSSTGSDLGLRPPTDGHDKRDGHESTPGISATPTQITENAASTSGITHKASRTQSFAQRLKSVRTPRVLIDGVILRNSSASQTPTSSRGPVDFPYSVSPAPPVTSTSGTKDTENIPMESIKPTELTTTKSGPTIPNPTCWKTIYYLLDLYATKPETKTVINRVSGLTIGATAGTAEESAAAGPFSHPRVFRNPSKEPNVDDSTDHHHKGISEPTLHHQTSAAATSISYPTNSLEKQMGFETPRLSIFGVGRIHRTRLLASLSGLKLEAEILNLQSTASVKKKSKPVALDLSLTGHIGSSMIVLLEGAAPTQQTVVKISISKSGVLYSSISKRSRDKNSALLTIGPVNVDIPQHPVVLHGMMTRSSKQLSSTLQEFRVNRTISRISRGTTFDEIDFATHLPVQHPPQETTSSAAAPERTKKPPTTATAVTTETPLFQPLVIQFTVLAESLSITAALLPSLQAQYKMEGVKSSGVTGSKAKFKIHLPLHTLSFTTKFTSSEANPLPSAASIELPKVDVCAEYIQDQGKGIMAAAAAASLETPGLENAVIRRGSYLSASAEIGAFEHCLTTDLLNHLVFVQKVFMREVNEVVLKMSGGDKPVPLWEDDDGPSSFRTLLFTLTVNLQGIQITATTPTNTAVRLETGLLEFFMSNRIQGVQAPATTASTKSATGPAATASGPTATGTMSSSSGSHGKSHSQHHQLNKVFVKAKVDVNLSLGQLIRNMVFEEAESEYQQYAFFKTRFGLRNDMSDDLLNGDSENADKEVVLITLLRPLIYIQPIAVDKAILVWLNYKNAYEYWNEQRSSLNTEVLAAMPQFQQASDHYRQPIHQHQQPQILNEQSSILFVQLTVEDMGISIPLNPAPHSWSGLRTAGESENRGAVVVTLESTSISACSFGSLVSKGKFTKLCFRFTDDMVCMDDWKPNLADPTVLNYCIVSEGTYEVCSRTNSLHRQSENAKWFLNVQWSMEGVDMHVDVNIGKQLSALGHTLTTLAAFEEDEDEDDEEDLTFDHHRENLLQSEMSQDLPDFDSISKSGRSFSQESVILRRQKSQPAEIIGGLAIDSSLGPREKRTLLEKEMQERVSLIAELTKVGAPEAQIEEERRKLQELESVAFKDFRRDWMKKLRRQSSKATSIKDKFGLGSGTSTKSTPPLTSKSFNLHSPGSGADSPFMDSPVDSTTDFALRPSHPCPSPTLENSSSSILSSTRPRTSSLRFIKHSTGTGNQHPQQRVVTFGETYRQYSADSAPTPDDDDYDVEAWLSSDEDQLGREKSSQITPGSSISHNKALEPNVDLELDVKVFINSGKCALHTKSKDFSSGSDSETFSADFKPHHTGAGGGSGRKKQHERERSGSGFAEFGGGSPLLNVKKLRPNLSSHRLVGATGSAAGFVGKSGQFGTDVTIFHVPGLDVKVHYDSHVLYEDEPLGSRPGPKLTTPERSTSDGSGSSASAAAAALGPNQTLLSTGRKSGTKRASLFAWTTLHSVPEETIISPHILDFLEQTLEPIPLQVCTNEKSLDNGSIGTDGASGVASTYYASFPVDVIVYFRMQPSTFRFSCQPISRVECMLRLPSLDIVFSSKRAEEKNEDFRSAQKLKFRNTSDSSKEKDGSFGPSGSGGTGAGAAAGIQHLAAGGLSVSGCLSDFSLYIFHPYGAAKKTAVDWSPLSDNERKDSVSMNVEFIKFNLSRSRKIYYTTTANVGSASGSGNLGSGPGGECKGGEQQQQQLQQAAIRFSTIVDIGSASFKYDMRRLAEILAFPKAWYRRSIVRRLFLGDLSTGGPGAGTFGEGLNQGLSSGSTQNLPQSGTNTPLHHPRSEERRHSGSALLTQAQRDKLKLNLDGGMPGEPKEMKRRGSKSFFRTPSKGKLNYEAVGAGASKESGNNGTGHNGNGPSKWETLVVFTVNFTKLNMHMNMGNVMGNVNWMIRDAKSSGKLSIGSSGHKNLYIGIGVDSSYIDAKGGIVAGTFELVHLNTFIRAREDPGIEPHHTVGLRVFGLELRLDFMGTSVLMGRGSGLQVTLKDEWQVRKSSGGGTSSSERGTDGRPKSDVALATFRPAMIFIHGDLGWDQLQLLISKSTTVDLLKMHAKLEEFFSQQFKSSKWVFSNLQAPEASPSAVPGVPAPVAKAIYKETSEAESSLWDELRHHRHWQEVLNRVSLLSISSLVNPLPPSGTVLGGTMDLHGNNISLACFHGINFKAKSWALFSLKEPFISFQTEAQETHSSHSGNVHVVQNLNFSLGQSNQQAMMTISGGGTSGSSDDSMAVVARITRNVIFPPQFRTLQEWFHYAFAASEIDDVQRFPSLEKERERLERERQDPGGNTNSAERRPTPGPRLHDPNHNREVIFALPTMELFFKTEHLQAVKTPDSLGNRPTVECSFITEFGDHIFVTVDAEAFFFLHDLITSYIKEKEKLVSAQLAAGRNQSPAPPAPTSVAATLPIPGPSGSNNNTEDQFYPATSSTEPSSPNTEDTLTVPESAALALSNLNDEELSALQRDWRNYHCKTWQLEPTVRLLSWAGKSIEPYGVDYILHKLGFSHARTTIPKWMQRGFMDPLDKLLSILVLRMIELARSDKQQQQEEAQNSSSKKE